jgi:hypothetical protein
MRPGAGAEQSTCTDCGRNGAIWGYNRPISAYSGRRALSVRRLDKTKKGERFMEFFAWLEQTGLAVQVRESLWVYPTVLTCHAIGMAVVVGLLIMIDLRVLGYARGIPMTALDTLYSFAWAGFALNLVSGSMLFVADAQKFVTSTPFIIKIVGIIIGGVLAWLLARMVATVPGGRGAMPGNARAVAAVSIVVWLIAITAGRLTAYI